MTDDALLSRIADALERGFPAPPAPAPSDAAAYQWEAGALIEAPFAPLPVDLLTGIDAQRDVLLENTKRLAQGHAAHDALLWGVRGAGKSALVKSVVGAVRETQPPLALVQAAGEALSDLSGLFATLSAWGRPTIIFIDDLGFDGTGSDAARTLRSQLDGGASTRPGNVRLYVTANRRHIVERHMAEQDDPINARDVVEDRLALADRFGISLGFHACDQDIYLAMVHAYAARMGVGVDTGDALLFAAQRGARSGRVAWHYAVELAGRAGLKSPL